jgi:hypothetical protein
MQAMTRPWVGLALALLLAGAPGALADKKEKKDKGKKAAGTSVTVTFTTDQRGAAQGWYVETYGRAMPPGLARRTTAACRPARRRSAT